MMNVKNISKRMTIFSFVIAATLCIMGFTVASSMNVTGRNTDLNDNPGEYSINGVDEPRPDDTIGDSDVMQESTSNPQDEKSTVSESNTQNDSNNDGKYLWPVTGYDRISSAYGTRMHPVEKTMVFNDGIDIPAPESTPVLAANTGTVAEIGNNETDGNYVILSHGGSIQTIYSKLFGFAEGLAAGDTVQQGDVIGYVGSTGKATGNHLHFSLTIDSEYIDPMSVFTQED